MTRTQILDAHCNIKKQRVSFISIIVISMIAVTAYLGIVYPAAAIRTYFANYYDRYCFRDLEVSSTMLMDDEDLKAIRALPGVEKAEGVYQIDAGLILDSITEKVSVLSTTRENAQPDRRRYDCPDAPA